MVYKIESKLRREVMVPLFCCPCEDPSGVLCQSLGPPTQKRSGAVGDGPEEDHKDGPRGGAPLL